MIDALLGGLKDQVTQELIGKIGVPENKIDDIINVAGDSTKEVMSSKLSSGMLDGVMNLFSKGQNNSMADTIQNELVNNFVGKLISKVGLPESMASMVSSVVVPKILSLVSSENEKTPATDTSSIVNMFGGSKGVMDKIGGLFK